MERSCPPHADNGTISMNYVKQFGVKPGSKVDLGKVDASFTDKHESHEQALPEIET